MKKHYEQLKIEFVNLIFQEVLSASAPICDNNDGTIGDIYDLL